MGNMKRLLLVEGDNDCSFFTEVCNKMNLNAQVKVAAPRDLFGGYNTKQGVIDSLPIHLGQLPDGQLERLGVIVDADCVVDGGGFERTLARISKVLHDYKFVSEPTRMPSGGLLFDHLDGLAAFGLWVMPNNRDEGMLEDWVQSGVRSDGRSLLEHAKDVVANLPEKKFKINYRTKAEVATWLAWQSKPGEGLYSLVINNLLDDKELSAYVGLRCWLSKVFL